MELQHGLYAALVLCLIAWVTACGGERQQCASDEQPNQAFDGKGNDLEAVPCPPAEPSD